MRSKEYHTAFDNALPIHIRALYTALVSVKSKADTLFYNAHECNCEYCDVIEDSELLVGNEEEYASLVAESNEIAVTIKRCISWAKFKGIKVSTDGIHVNLNTLERLDESDG
jgi:hypothetical protein